MPSLAQLLTDHPSLLVLDASSTRVQVGLLRTGAAPLWHAVVDEAGTALFVGVDAVLRQGDFALDRIAAFVFCEGPGSILGIRTSAMAIRTWQILKTRPVYAYQSLAIAGGHEWAKTRRAVTVVADARRDSWHLLTNGADGLAGSLQRVATADLPAGELLTPENFRSWSSPPRPLTTCSYDLAILFPVIVGGDYFHAVETPDAFSHAAPEYKKWSAQVHQAPVTPAR